MLTRHETLALTDALISIRDRLTTELEIVRARPARRISRHTIATITNDLAITIAPLVQRAKRVAEDTERDPATAAEDD